MTVHIECARAAEVALITLEPSVFHNHPSVMMWLLQHGRHAIGVWPGMGVVSAWDLLLEVPQSLLLCRAVLCHWWSVISLKVTRVHGYSQHVTARLAWRPFRDVCCVPLGVCVAMLAARLA